MKWMNMAVLVVLLICLLMKVQGEYSKKPIINRERYVKVRRVSVGASLKIFCSPKELIEKRSPNKYIWTKNGQLLDRHNDRYKIKKFDFLKIKAATLDDNGVYKCIIRTPKGQDSISVKVFVSSKGLGSGLGLRFINENFNMELVEVTGNKLELDCSVYSIAGTITVTWLKDGKKLTEDYFNSEKDKRRISSNGQRLVLQKLQSSDKGKYECRVTDGKTKINRIMTVQPEEVVRASPHILQPADKAVFLAEIGQNMTVECVAYADGNMHFQLLKVKKNRNADGSTSPLEVVKKHTEFIFEEKSASTGKWYRAIFHFSNITKKDFDVYTCMAGNSVGFSATSFRIKEKIPGLRFINKDIVLELIEVVGNKLVLDCSVHTISGTVTVTWFKDGKKLAEDYFNGEKDKRRISSNGQRLVLQRLQSSDKGKYECRVTDGKTKINRIMTVQPEEVVRASPHILQPADKAVFLAEIGQNMTVECVAYAGDNMHFQLLKVKKNRNADGSTSPLEVVKKHTEFISEEKSASTGKWYRAIFHFSNITKKDFDVYICMAGNAVGYSATSFRIKEKIPGLRFINKDIVLELIEVVGNKLVLDCSVHTISGTVTVTWFKDGKKLTEDYFYNEKDKRRISSNGQRLVLQRLQSSDKGKYECRVTDGKTKINRIMTVQPEEVIRASPYILQPPDHSVFWAEIGQNMTVECAAFASGNIHFQLLKVKENRTSNGSDSPLEIVKKHVEFTSEKKSPGTGKRLGAIFHFSRITNKDFNMYTCMAGNAVGFSATSFRIKEKRRSSASAPDAAVKESKYTEM